MVWVSRHAATRGERVSTTECPVSLISGESRAAVEEWVAVRRLGGLSDVSARPARTIDAWLVLEAEREGLETNSDAD